MKNVFLISFLNLLLALSVVLFGCESTDDGEDGDTGSDSGTEMDTSSDMMDTSMHNDSDTMTHMDTNGAAYMDISAAQVMTMMESEENVVVVDVSPIYNNGHIPGSINLYVGGTEIDDALPLIDKTFTYIIYCHNDAASTTGAQKFVDGGFPNVYRLEGNYSAWTGAGYPVEKTGDGYMDLSAATAKVLIDGKSNVATIDVSPYYGDGHLPGAMHYFFGDGSLEGALSTLDDSQIYLVYCHADGPSIAGAELLFDNGFSPVYRLRGNYGAWTAKGFPVSM